jgi:hypothetical protein
MKTILYVFAMIWFALGLGALIGGQQVWMGSWQAGPPSASSATDTATIGWYWLWMFLMPALLAAAMGAVLGRLDAIRDAIEFFNEREDAEDIPPEPVERMDPYIGEGYLGDHRPGRKNP